MFPLFLAEFKSHLGPMEVAKRQNQNNRASTVNLLLRLKRAIRKEDEIYDSAYVLSLDYNGITWKIRCRWVSRESSSRDAYYSKVLEAWDMQAPGDENATAASYALKNIVHWMRDLMYPEILQDVRTFEDKGLPAGAFYNWQAYTG